MPESIQLMFTDTAYELTVEPPNILLARLNDSQISRYKSITNPARRKTWLMGRALLMAAVEHQYGCCNPESIRTDPYGGVMLDGINAQVSLSHSHNMCVVSFSKNRVGVDIEYRKKRKLVRHTSHLFATAESRHLYELMDAEQLDAFYTYWTLKEAACKASAMPLITCMRNFCFDLQNCTFRLHESFTTQDWCFMTAPVELNWRMALAIPNTNVVPRIEAWQFTAGGKWHRLHLDQNIFLPATDTHRVR